MTIHDITTGRDLEQSLADHNERVRAKLSATRDAKAGAWDTVVQSSRLIAECKDAELRAECKDAELLAAAREKVCELVLELADMIGKITP